MFKKTHSKNQCCRIEFWQRGLLSEGVKVVAPFVEVCRSLNYYVVSILYVLCLAISKVKNFNSKFV